MVTPDTPQFITWFGDSKVVDENGKPRVMYHSTVADFSRFRRSRNDLGFHFGTKGQAEDRFLLKTEHDPYGTELGRVQHSTMPVYLSIRKPLRLPDIGDWRGDNLWHELGGMPGFEAVRSDMTSARIRDIVKSMGYDGIVYKNTGETGGGALLRKRMKDARKALFVAFPGQSGFTVEEQKHPLYASFSAAMRAYEHFRETNSEDSYIAFDPAQVKSAISNIGAFSRKNPDIRFERRVEEPLDQPGMFQKWFGDSKVVNADGSPQVVYRGESGGELFNRFDHRKTYKGVGFFFAASKEHAHFYAGRGTSPREFYLRVENLLDLTDPYVPHNRTFLKRYEELFDEWVDRHSGEPTTPHDLLAAGDLYGYEGTGSGTRWNVLFQFAEEMGYDGVKVLDSTDAGPPDTPVFVVFHPSHIKSATENAGTYDLGNADIRFARPDESHSSGQSEPPFSLKPVADLSQELQSMIASMEAAGQGDGRFKIAAAAFLDDALGETPTLSPLPQTQGWSKTSANLPQLKAAAVEARETFRSFLDAPRADRAADVDFASVSSALYDTKQALVGAIAAMPDDGFALQGTTRDGRLVLLNASAQRAGHWQLTRFDAAGEPWGDSQYSTKRQAIEDFLSDISLKTLDDIEHSFDAPADITESESFKRWFGNSKVIDADGKPMPLYHGTTADFTVFQKTKDLGFHFGTLPQAHAVFGRKRKGRNIIKAYVSIKNPLRLLDDPRSWNPEYVIPRAIPTGILSDDEKAALLSEHEKAIDAIRNIYRGGGADWDELYFGAQATTLGKLRDILEAKGYDGIVYWNKYERAPRADSWVAFRPHQIKSAIGNNQDFDLKNPDIRFSAVASGGSTLASVADNSAFAAWFGNSKIVDDAGKPLVMYHGGHFDAATFSAFSPDLADPENDLGAGFYFSSSRADAEGYDYNREHGEDNPQVLDVYLSVQNPYIIGESKLPDGVSEEKGEAFRTAVEAAGYDGIIDRAVTHKFADEDYHPAPSTVHVVAFFPEQIKSATSNNGAFSRSTADIRFSQQAAPVFYSALARAIPGLRKLARKDGTVQTDQIRTWLHARQQEGKFKAEELHWSGLLDWLDLQGPRASVSEVEAFVQQSGPTIQEVIKRYRDFDECIAIAEGSGDAEVATLLRRTQFISQLRGRGDGENNRTGNLINGARQPLLFEVPPGDDGRFLSFESVDRAKNLLETGNEPRYGRWSQPGGEDYHEILLTFPVPAMEIKYGETVPHDGDGVAMLEGRHRVEGVTVTPFTMGSHDGRIMYWPVRYNWMGDARPGGYQVNSAMLQNAWFDTMEAAQAEIEKHAASDKLIQKHRSDTYKSPHWHEHNVIAHVRFSTQYDVNGERILLIDEMQSDWAQEGRKKGFGHPLSRLVKVGAESQVGGVEVQNHQGDVLGWGHTPEEAASSAAEYAPGVLTAPYVMDTKAWVRLALKRMIRYAAEDGFDRIAVINGEQAAERFDISKQVDKVRWFPATGELYAEYAGREVVRQRNVPADTLSDFVGKEVADRLLKAPEKQSLGTEVVKELDGENLKILGDGMRSFYNEIVPQVAVELLKRMGGGHTEAITLRLPDNRVPLKVGDKWTVGAKTGDTTRELAGNVQVRTRKEAQAIINAPAPALFSFAVTPTMRAMALQGQPMFSRMAENAVPPVLYHGTNTYFHAFSVSEDIGFHFGDEDAARDRMSRIGNAHVEVKDYSPSPIDVDCAREQAGTLTITPVTRVYGLLLRKLAHPRSDLLSVLSGMSEDELDQARQEYENVLDDPGFVDRAMRGATGPRFAVEVNGESIATFSNEKSATQHARAIEEEMRDPMEVHLALKNPIRLPDLGVWPAMEIAEHAGFSEAEREQVDGAQTLAGKYEVVRTILKARGHDGIVYTNEVENPGGDSFIAFDPDQIYLLRPSRQMDAVRGPVAEQATFKAWFGSSKAVDNTGKPLVVYHGTERSGFAEFDYASGSYGRGKETHGFHFTESRRNAATYSGRDRDAEITSHPDFSPRYDGEGGIYPVYLKMDNPFEIDFADENGDSQNWDAEVEGFFGVDDVAKHAKAQGYDSVIVRNVNDEGPHGQGYGWGNTTYIVFSPQQIKSATNNVGTFDPDSPDIRFDRQDPVAASAPPPKLNDRPATDSQAFKQWFGNSQVADKDGKPLVVYHGTRFDFSEFDGYDVAGWFSSDPDLASDRYAFGESDDAGPNVMSVYLSLQNPKYIDGDMDDVGEDGRPMFESINHRDYVEKLIAQGYDGIVVNENGSCTYAAFHSGQIKSATANLGTFDRDKSDIRFERTNDILAEPSKTHPAGASTESWAFQRWFSGSKVVDGQGSPLIVYHGSQADIAEFNTKGGTGKTYDTGAFFTSSAAVANTYAAQNGGNVTPVYLNLRNPAVIDANGANWARLTKKTKINLPAVEVSDQEDEDLLAALEERTPEQGVKKQRKARKTSLGRLFPDELVYADDFASTDDMARWARSQGYDGLIINNIRDHGPSGAYSTDAAREPVNLYVAFHPNQIKSAKGNLGTYDPRNPDIRFGRGSMTPENQKTDTFGNWFGSSQVVDANGNAAIVYHGTCSDFSVFDAAHLGSNVDNPTTALGFFFSDAVEDAERWHSYNYARCFGGGQMIMPVFLRLQNPMAIDADRFTDLLQTDPPAASRKLRHEAEKLGHDGFIVKRHNGRNWYATFRPEQIKSCVGNRGTFDLANPDIRFKQPVPDWKPAPTMRPLFRSTLKIEAKAVQTLSAFFDTKVAVLRTTDDTEFLFNGVSYAGTVWINERSTRPLHTLFGHELLHKMKAERPDLYAGLRQALLPILKDEGRFARISRLIGKDIEYVREEMIADLVGDRFSEKPFWESVARGAKATFKDTADYVNSVVGSLLERLQSSGIGESKESAEFVTDLAKARQAIASVLTEYLQWKQSNKPRAPFQDNVTTLLRDAIGPPAPSPEAGVPHKRRKP